MVYDEKMWVIGGKGVEMKNDVWWSFSNYSLNGSFISFVIYADSNVNFSTIQWSEELPSSTGITIQTRTSLNGTQWSDWSSELTDPAGSQITSPSGKYIQYKANLSGDGTVTPVLKDVTISGIYSSGSVFSIDISPQTIISWDKLSWQDNEPEGTDIKYQVYHYHPSSLLWEDEFNDGDISNVDDGSYISDLWEYGGRFQNIVEENGILTFSNATSSPYDEDETDVYPVIFTGKDKDYFPAGSIIKAKIKTITNSPSFKMCIFTDDWEDGGECTEITNDWVELEFEAEEPFNIIGFNFYNFDDPANDQFQIDWVRIEAPGLYTLISDEDLPGNSTGFDDPPIDLSNLSPTTYPSIAIKATLSSNSSVGPTISSWQVSWKTGQKETPKRQLGSGIVRFPETQSGIVRAIASGGKTTTTTNEGIKISLEVPPAALSQPVVFKIVPIPKKDFPLPSKKAILGNYLFDLTATLNGKLINNFNREITLTFNYPDDLLSNLNESTLKIYYWDKENKNWVFLPSLLDPVKNSITTTINHFTYFAILGEIKEKMTPEEILSKIVEILKNLIQLYTQLLQILKK